MGSHDEISLALINKDAERFQLPWCPSIGHVHKAVVRVVDCIAVTREMLECTQHALAAALVYKPASMTCNHLRINREAPQVMAHGGTVMVQHIDHWRQIDIHTSLTHLAGQACGIIARRVLVIHRPQVLGCLRRQEAVLWLEACHLAAFLVGGNEQGIVGPCPELRRHARQPLLAGDIARAYCSVTRHVDVKQHDGAHLQVSHISRRVTVFGHAVALETHHEHPGGIAPNHRIGR